MIVFRVWCIETANHMTLTFLSPPIDARLYQIVDQVYKVLPGLLSLPSVKNTTVEERVEKEESKVYADFPS